MALSVVNPSKLNKWRVYVVNPSTGGLASTGSAVGGDADIQTLLTETSGALDAASYEEVGKCTGYPSWESTYGDGQLDNYGGTSAGQVTFTSTVNLIGLNSTNWTDSMGYHEATVDLCFVAPDTGVVRQFSGVTAIVTDMSDDAGRQMVKWEFNKIDTSVDNFSTYDNLLLVPAT